MKKSGLKKPSNINKFNATDISLVIVLAFCSLVIFFIGYHCCQRKRSKGKNKAAKRKIRNKESREENGDLLAGCSQASDDSLDKEGQNLSTHGQHSFKERPREEEVENQSPNNHPVRPSLLSRIMLSWPTRSFKSHKENSRGCKSLDDSVNSTKDSPKGRPKSSSTSNVGNEQDLVSSRQTRSKTKSNNSKAKTSADSEPSSSLEVQKDDGKKGKSSTRWPFCRGKEPSSNGHKKGDDGSGDVNKEKKAKKNSANLSNHGEGSSKKNGKQAVKEMKNERSSRSRGTREVEGELPSLDGVSNEKSVVCNRIDGETEAQVEILMPMRESKVNNVENEIDDAMNEDVSSKVEIEHKKGQTEKNIYENLPKGSQRQIEGKIEKTSIDSYQNPPSPKDDFNFKGESFRKDDFTDHSLRREASLEAPRRIESIGEVYNVVQYARNEWKSDTDKAKAIREGYFQIPQLLGLNSLRVIRGDNYCAIRAALFQVLAKNIPTLSKLGELTELPKALEDYKWINGWNFASRLPVQRDQVLVELKTCMKELSDLVQLNAQMANDEGRVAHLLANFNFKPVEYEIRLLEAVKFLMLYNATRLYAEYDANENPPLFAIIMFARDTSTNPREFMINHLNAVGNTGGLEQVEMHLLGYTLGVTIKVVRPSYYGQPDFIASYPEGMPDRTPVVTMVAEDDRHYNILS